ncbi:MAG: aspartate aminotransferase family protein [Thermodesulfobacteriota bacterium]
MRRDDLDRLDRAHLVHGFGSPAVAERDGTLRLVKGRGVWVWDAEGRRYLDAVASLWNVNVGHGRAEIGRAMAKQASTLEYAPTLLGFSSEPAIALAARIARLAPPGLEHVVFTSGGSESNESVIRLTRVHWRLRGRPDKIKIVALSRAYHGSSTGAASLTGLEAFHRHYEPMLPDVLRMARPYCYRCELGRSYPECDLDCTNELERVVAREGAERIGACIVEPVQGVGGVVVPPPGWLERLRAVCDRHEILLVADEVITGFGRTGKPFAVQHGTAVPDMLVFAKGVTSGYAPLGGVVLHERVYRTLVDAGPEFTLHHGFTYSGHPVACAAGLANLEIIERERLIPAVRRLGGYLRRRLARLERHAIVGEVRSIGLMAAIDLVRDRARREPFAEADKVPWQVRRAALERGVIVRAGSDAIALCPPFVVTPAQIDQIVDVLDQAIGSVATSVAAAA